MDDLRTPPDWDTGSVEWGWAKTSVEAIAALRYFPIEELSLDHDLGDDDTTREIILQMCDGLLPWPEKIVVHSANPVGREWLEGMIERYKP